jgi:hypothetical protein
VNWKNDPKFWALIGFGFGAVLASGGSLSNPVDSLLGGVIQAAIWFFVARGVIRRLEAKKNMKNVELADVTVVKGTGFLLFDKPFYKDWLFYVFLFSLVSNLVNAMNNVSQSGGWAMNSYGSVASGVTDALFRIFLSWFPLIPILYFVRKSIRLIRSRKPRTSES